MKRKSLIATIAATTLLLSSMSVMAANEDLTYDVTGDINYVNTKIYCLELPTTTGLKFTLDPQGLLSLDNGDYNPEEAGKINSDPIVFKNWSSLGVQLTASFYVDDSGDSTTTLNLKNDADSVDDSAKDMFIDVQSSADGGEFASAIVVTSKVSSAGTSDTFNLEKAGYTFVKDGETYKYELADDATAHSVSLKITGSIAKDYDWSAYSDGTNTIKLGAVFSFKDAAGTGDITYTTATPAPVPTPTPTPVPDPTLSADGLEAVDGQEYDYTLTYNRTSGNTLTVANAVVTAVTYGGTVAGATNSDSAFVSEADTTVTIANGLWSSATAGTYRYVKITLEDGTVWVVRLTMP